MCCARACHTRVRQPAQPGAIIDRVESASQSAHSVSRHSLDQMDIGRAPPHSQFSVTLTTEYQSCLLSDYIHDNSDVGANKDMPKRYTYINIQEEKERAEHGEEDQRRERDRRAWWTAHRVEGLSVYGGSG